HTWMSRQLGKDPGNIQALDTFWTDWSEATQPPLSAELLISGRDEAAERITHLLQRPSGMLTVRADAQDEALAFIAAAIEKLPEGERDALFARTFIVESVRSWQKIPIAEQPVMLPPTFKPVDVVQAPRRGHHVLIPAGR